MKQRLLTLACCLVLTSTIVVKASYSDLPPGAAQDPAAASLHSAIDCGSQPCDSVARGFAAFLDSHMPGLDANGRACADCHMPSDHFQLSPASVEARFQRLQEQRLSNPNADDPLFRPIDADDFRINGDSASDYSNLRENGLVRLTFPLPANIRLIDPATNMPSSEVSVDVWRMTPTVENVALTGLDTTNPWFRGPNETGGYQLDGRITTLQEQALGALVNHAQIQNPAPQRLLDDLASFQRRLFTDPRVQELSDAIDAGTVPLPDADPVLDELEQQGKVVFQRACAQCHGGASQSNAVFPVIRFHDIASQCPRQVDTVTPPRFVLAPCPPRLARNARTYEITLPAAFGGATVRRTSSDPGRALLTGFVGGPPPRDDWNKFDVPGLRGISNTAPYFHNNSADTLEAVVDHYIELFKVIRANAPPGPPPPVATTDGVHFDRAPLPEERAALLAYLRAL